MNRFILLFYLLFSATFVLAQNKDTANISITGFTLNPGTFSWRGTGTYHNMTGFNSAPYTEGHLKQGTQFRMNYRLLFPELHNPSYQPGYPMIVMLHGAGERGNCWDENCYCGGCQANVDPGPGADPRFLNNDHNLVHGGKPHFDAVDRANGKLPEDPTLGARDFPGFVLFPQMLNQWRNSASPGNSDLSFALRIIRLLVRQYNIDQDRIYIHGLSMGGQATLEALNYADWLFAAAAPMSAISFQQSLEYDSVKNIPFWFFQGGRDGNPKPSQTKTMVHNLREKGANVRYTEYPNLSHGTWNTAYAEPDFFSWLLSHRKSNIHVDYNNPNICGTTGAGAGLMLPQGFLAYQWERDGEIIPGATSHSYTATFPGVYRARFSRKSHNPTSEADWNRWSDPVTVGEKSPEAPVVEQIGTVVLSNLNNEAFAILNAPEGYLKYTWLQNGVPPFNPTNVSILSEPHLFRIGGCTGGGFCSRSGAYTLITEGYDKCPSLPSQPKYIIFGTHNTGTVPPVITGTPTALAGEIKSPNSILLTWQDNSPDERHFEIWRRKFLNVVGENFNQGWIMATITGEDETTFLDTGLEASTTYWYKIRGVNNKGRSHYHPGNAPGNANQNYKITTPGESISPSPPTNLIATSVGVGTIELTWQPAVDQSGIKQYLIYYNGLTVATGANGTTFMLTDLDLNNEYVFTVKAEDPSGNLSEASNPAMAHTYVEGLYYKHSTGAWSQMSQMAATWDSPEFTGWVATFTLQPRTQDDFFNFQYDGFLYIVNGGTYQFRTASDDGSQLFLNGVRIVNNDGLHGNQTVTSGNQNLSAGPIPIMVRYFENTGGQSLTVSYRGPDTNNNWVTIPASALRSGTPPPPPLPPAAPTNLAATAAGMQTIDLDWDHDPLTVVVLGSSTAAGTGASPSSNSWVNLFDAWLDANTDGANVINLAQGGFDTRDVLPTGDPDQNITYALSLNPDVILVNLPSNDAANNIPLTETIDNLETIRDLALAQNVRIFFTTSQPRNFPDAAKRELLNETAESIRGVFGEYVIDIYDELTNFVDYTIKAEYNADNIHVNNAGHYYIFTEVRDKLIPYLPSFEIQRGLSVDGPFAAINRTLFSSYNDAGLIPDTPYYYRVRTTSVDTVSAFTPIVNATTFADNQIPTTPGTPVVWKKSFATVSLTWTPQSVDNVGISGYEVYQDGQYIGFSASNAYQVTGLEPGETYTFYVVAVDLNDNKSLPSGNVMVTTEIGFTFYSKPDATILADLSSWENGVGEPPVSFDHNGQFFLVQHPLPVGSNWSVEGSVSKVIIDDNVNVTIGTNPVTAKLDIPGNGVLNLNHATLPDLRELSPTSTVNYGTKFVQQADYGNLGFTTPEPFTFPAGISRVRGNLSAVGGASLKGASGNTTTVELNGNLIFSGSPATLASGFGINFELMGNGNHTIQTGGTLDLFQINKNGTGVINLLNNGAPATMNLGSSAGGGLFLPAGAEFNLGDNTLAIVGAGSINGNGETGLLAVNGGTVSISSVSGNNSHLYFKTGANTAHTLYQNMSGGGDVVVHSPVSITDAVKIRGGDLVSNGNITLLSTLNKTANLQEIENNGSIVGNLNVQRYMNNKTRTYRYISSPVEGVTVATWQNFFPITGNFTGTSTGTGLTTQPSLYIREPEGWVPYPQAPLTNTAPIERGRGYAAFVRNSTPVLIQVSGVPYQGNVPFNLFPPQGGDEINDWNLLGNPYASTIAWSNNTDAWIKSDVGNVIAVRNNFNTTSGQFQYFDSGSELSTEEDETLMDGKIAPGQAFWVKATGPTPAITVTEKAKHTGQQDFYREKSNAVSHLRIRVTQNTKKDAALILLTDYGTDSYDARFDGIKMSNEGLHNLSTVTDNNYSVAINNLSDAFCTKNVPINLTGTAPGNYTLEIESPETLYGVGTITLKDHFADSLLTVNESTQYPFAVTSDPLSFGRDRFELVFDRPALNLAVTGSAEKNCHEPAYVTLTNTQAGASYALFRDGIQVSDLVSSSGQDLTLTVPSEKLKAGINSLLVQASFKGCASAMLPGAISVMNYPSPVVSAPDVSVCLGSSADLRVTGTGTVSAYEWFGEDGKIKGVTGPNLTTDIIHYEKIYSVNAVDPNGCAGPRKIITVTPESLDEPEIIFHGDTLYTTTLGSEYIWSRNGEIVQRSAAGTSFVPSSNGTYILTVTKGGCSRNSREHLITGIDETGSVFTCELFPNPTATGNINLRIRTDSDEDIRVRIVDIVGRELYSSVFSSDALTEDIRLEPSGEIKAGVYFLQLDQDSRKHQIKFIIKE